MKKEYITPAIYVIQMDDVCGPTIASVGDEAGNHVDSFNVNAAASDDTLDDVGKWGGE